MLRQRRARRHSSHLHLSENRIGAQGAMRPRAWSGQASDLLLDSDEEEEEDSLIGTRKMTRTATPILMIGTKKMTWSTIRTRRRRIRILGTRTLTRTSTSTTTRDQEEY